MDPWHGLVYGLSPGGHGFHIHETGLLRRPTSPPPATTSTARAPATARSSAPAATPANLPNPHAAANGTARADVFTATATLETGPGPLRCFHSDGSAIIIHEQPDSYGEAAGAGRRVACGVIRLARRTMSLIASGQ